LLHGNARGRLDLGNRARELSVSVPRSKDVALHASAKQSRSIGAWTWLSRLMPRRFQATEKTAMAISTELAEALARCAAPATVTGPDRFLGILTALVRSIILPVRVALNNRFAGEVSGKNDCTRRLFSVKRIHGLCYALQGRKGTQRGGTG
jgi:hypothetical protein